MADISTLEPLVRPFVLDCPRFLVVAELRRAARSFFDRSRVWTRTLNATVANGAIDSMDLMPSNLTVVSFVEIRDPAKKLPLPGYASPQDFVTLDPSLGFTAESLVDLILTTYPETTNLEIKVVVKPSLSGSDVPAHLLEKWGEVIADGAAASLMMQKGKEWYDPAQAGVHKQQFNTGITSARNEKAAGFVNANLTASGRPFI